MRISEQAKKMPLKNSNIDVKNSFVQKVGYTKPLYSYCFVSHPDFIQIKQ